MICGATILALNVWANEVTFHFLKRLKEMLPTAVIQAIEYQKKKVYSQGGDAAYLTSGTSVFLIFFINPTQLKKKKKNLGNLRLFQCPKTLLVNFFPF